MTVAERVRIQRSETKPANGEQRILLHGVDWQAYEKILDAVGDRPIFLTYDRGSLEIMSPSYWHGNYTALLGRLIEILTFELRMPLKACGMTTFRRQDLERGLEPDTCFYIRNAASLKGKKKIDLSRDPPPDLAIEVDIFRSSLDRMAIYAALGVPEVWRFDGETLHVYQLALDRVYKPCRRSPTFPFLPLAKITYFLHQSEHKDDNEIVRAFLQWVRKQITADWKEKPRKR